MLRRFRPYFRYLKSNRGTLVAAIFYGLIFGVSTGLGFPTLVKYVFPPIFDRSGTPLPINTILLIVGTVPLVFLLRAVSGYLNSYYVQLTGQRILEGVRLEYFSKLQWLPLSYLQRKSSGDLISRGTSDTAQLQFTLSLIADDGVKQPIQLLFALGFLIWQAFATDGAALVLVCLAVVPLTVLPVHYVGKKIVARALQVQNQIGDISSHFVENLAGAREVRAFGLEQREIQRFGRATGALVIAQMKTVKYSKALTPAIEILCGAGIAATLLFAYKAGVKWETFFAIIMALYLCYEPIKKIGYLNTELNRGTASMERLEQVLNEPLIITDPAAPVPVTKLRGHVEFKDVTFAYGDSPALKKVNASIPAGTVCALVGPSGAGKSTFANLVPRFFEAGAGAITIDGIEVRAMRLADLRRNIALVSQEPVLFNDTIYNNLALGTAVTSRDEILAAARLAHAHEFIEKLPQGYDTMVGERGALLSGGQKQRIAIARAFLRHAPILILDEATSALDSDSEAAVQDALRRLVSGRTVLIIAHRFSTIRDASMILVFDQGEIVAQGDHASLYAGNALYKSLYDRQNTGV
ncbi:ABC transporter ATP-binding protein [Opitutus sp. GAS368]|uniref:ABC transporter ATP-binding protein n=1 Tax=Opitutus sp. GAS368 TaxID=1882749 RepID=UPI00087B20F7|nr:ABC transporter ATP-binding protein [Opitutus sp. GAS368]SDS22620.1 ATP-binding cassette, subfamily B, MsbA [Opitutus sp. GAS368]